ncbi:MAG: extracellular solute-binding protein [Spirochaetales bacterium]|nr:extracellular solute-binding protein [Spirochaetales bacterium]
MRKVLIIAPLLFLLISCGRGETELELGIFSGSAWGVPNWQSFLFFDEAIDKFTGGNPGISVVYRSGTLREDYSEWLSQKMLKGEEPDIFLILPEDFVLFSSIGILEDLEPYMEKDPDFHRDDYFANALKSGLYGNEQFGFPLEVVPTLMFVNETILDEKGLSVPGNDWTWDDLYRISYDLSSYYEEEDNPVQAVSGFDWKMAAYTNGRSLFSDEGDRIHLLEDGVREAITFAGRLEGLNRSETARDFENGDVAFTPMPFSEYRSYAFYPYSIKKYSTFDWKALLLPSGPGGDKVGELRSLLIGISSRSTHKREAWEFLKFLVSDRETQTNIFHYSQGVPVLKEVLEQENVKIFLSRGRDVETPLLTAEQITSAIERSLVIPRFPRYEEALEMADGGLKSIEVNPSRLEHQISVLEREINDFLQH